VRPRRDNAAATLEDPEKLVLAADGLDRDGRPTR
jgi:hypothetical protein